MIIIFLLLLMPVYAFSDEDSKAQIVIPEPADMRIDGYRKDYRPKQNDDIQFIGKKFSKKQKADEKTGETDPEIKAIKDPEVKETAEMKKLEDKAPEKPTEPKQTGYTGATKDGKKNGQGIYVFPNGLKYSGQWENDKMNGYGSFMFPDGGTYIGEVKDNQITGTGTFKYTDGSIYEGEWKNGFWNGKGTYRLTDGREIHAIFVKNKPVKDLSTEEEH